MAELPASNQNSGHPHRFSGLNPPFSEASSETPSSETLRLVQLAGDNHPAAFNDLVDRVNSRLCAIAHRMLSNYPQVRRWEQTDDVMQEMLLRMNRALHEVKPESAAGFFGLAVTLTRRILIDLSRHYYGVYGMGTKHKSAVMSGSGEHELELDNLRFVDPITDLDDWTEFHEAIERLPEPEKEAFSLKWYAGLTQREISELTGVSERTIIRRVINARTRLTGWLVDDEVSS